MADEKKHDYAVNFLNTILPEPESAEKSHRFFELFNESKLEHKSLCLLWKKIYNESELLKQRFEIFSKPFDWNDKGAWKEEDWVEFFYPNELYEKYRAIEGLSHFKPNFSGSEMIQFSRDLGTPRGLNALIEKFNLPIFWRTLEEARYNDGVDIKKDAKAKDYQTIVFGFSKGFFQDDEPYKVAIEQFSNLLQHALPIGFSIRFSRELVAQESSISMLAGSFKNQIETIKEGEKNG